MAKKTVQKDFYIHKLRKISIESVLIQASKGLELVMPGGIFKKCSSRISFDSLV